VSLQAGNEQQQQRHDDVTKIHWKEKERIQIGWIFRRKREVSLNVGQPYFSFPFPKLFPFVNNPPFSTSLID